VESHKRSNEVYRISCKENRANKIKDDTACIFYKTHRTPEKISRASRTSKPPKQIKGWLLGAKAKVGDGATSLMVKSPSGGYRTDCT
jgi:hypothetical protein